MMLFFRDRMKVLLKGAGYRHDCIDAVLDGPDGKPDDRPYRIVSKLEALTSFLKTDDGANLAAAYKRAANILKAEEKKDGAPADPAEVNEAALVEAEEKALFAALQEAKAAAKKLVIVVQDFEAAMSALAKLRGPLDAFFEKVTVNADDAALRANRLSLLASLTAATAEVADFSKLEG